MAKIKHAINRSKRHSVQCRNNNQCSYCRSSRTHNSEKKKAISKLMME